MSTSPSDRVLRSVCRRLGFCACTDELPALRRRSSQKLRLAPVQNAALGDSKAVSLRASGTSLAVLQQPNLQIPNAALPVAASTCTTLAPYNRQAVSSAALAFSSSQDTRSGLRAIQVARNQAAERTLGGCLVNAGRYALGPFFWSIVFLLIALLIFSLAYCCASKENVTQTISVTVLSVGTHLQAFVRTWNQRMCNWLVLFRSNPTPSVVPAEKLNSHGESTKGDFSSDIRALRAAIKNIEGRIATVASRVDQLATLAPPTSQLDEASLGKRLSAEVEAKLTDRMQRELVKLKSALDSLTADLDGKSRLAGIREKAADEESRKQAERLEKLQQLVASLRRSVESTAAASTCSGKQTCHRVPAVEADSMPDFALASGGARIVSTGDSRPVAGLFDSWWLRWWRRRGRLAGPEVALTASVQLGDCWAFKGFPGRLLVRLSHPIRITAVTIDHLSRHQAYNDSVSSAPKEFSVYGLPDCCDGGRDAAVKLGSFSFDAEIGPSTQTFRLGQATRKVYPYAELVINSNHGNLEYTCLYRFRVHGHIN